MRKFLILMGITMIMMFGLVGCGEEEAVKKETNFELLDQQDYAQQFFYFYHGDTVEKDRSFLYNSEITIDGVNIKLPCKPSVLKDMGWYEEKEEYQFENFYVEAGTTTPNVIRMRNDKYPDITIAVAPYNYSEENVIGTECDIYQLSVSRDMEMPNTTKVTLNDNITFGDSYRDIISVLGHPSMVWNESADKFEYYDNTWRSILFRVTDETGVYSIMVRVADTDLNVADEWIFTEEF